MAGRGSGGAVGGGFGEPGARSCGGDESEVREMRRTTQVVGGVVAGLMERCDTSFDGDGGYPARCMIWMDMGVCSMFILVSL